MVTVGARKKVVEALGFFADVVAKDLRGGFDGAGGRFWYSESSE